jgi:hypothetical protein
MPERVPGAEPTPPPEKVRILILPLIIKETLVNEGLTPATQTNFEDGWISG